MARRRTPGGNGTAAGNGNGPVDAAKIMEDLSPEARRWIEKHPVTPEPEPPANRLSTVEFTTVIGNPKVRSKQDRPSKRGELVILWAKDIREEAVDWLWEGRIPQGMLTLISGDKGAGKSNLACWIASAVSTGSPWPDQPGKARRPGSVLYFNAEEHPESIWKPRLMRFGADMGRVGMIDSVKPPGADEEELPFSLQHDMQTLEENIARLKDVRLVVIDTISSYVLSMDASNGAEVRRVLLPLKRLAEKHALAVVMNNHMNKGAGTKAIYRVKDSIEFPNVARMTSLVAPDPDDRSRRIFAPGDSNFNLPPALAFTIGRDGAFAWDPKPIEGLNADELLAREARVMARAGRTGRPGRKIREAMNFVLTNLGKEGTNKADLQKEAASRDFPESTFRDAIKRLKEGGRVDELKAADGLLVVTRGSNFLSPEDDGKLRP